MSDDAVRIEGGATTATGDLRYWRAKEAVRQGEVRLNAQAAIRTALESRATAITGWAAASLLALSAAGFTTSDRSARYSAAFAAVFLFGSSVVSIHAARPRNWSIAGYAPSVITEDRLDSELESLESMASGIGPGIQWNNRRLERMGQMLRWSGWLLITAPIAGAALYYALRFAT